MEETTPTFGNTRRNEKMRRLEIYREEEGQQEDLAMVGERENDDENLELGDDDLGGVCFFYLILNITFFELNAE